MCVCVCASVCTCVFRMNEHLGDVLGVASPAAVLLFPLVPSPHNATDTKGQEVALASPEPIKSCHYALPVSPRLQEAASRNIPAVRVWSIILCS